MIDRDELLLERAARILRAPAQLDFAHRDRIIEAVRDDQRRRGSRWRASWLVRARSVRMSPLLVGAVAAGLVVVGIGLGRVTDRTRGSPTPPLIVTSAQPDQRVVRFVLAAPTASRVSLVGEFNGWDVAATPMVAADGTGLWSVALPLAPGRHVYAFFVDGATWINDPGAPLTPDDGFGVRNSVMVITGDPST